MVVERSAPDAKDDDLDDARPEKQDATHQDHGTQSGQHATYDEGHAGQDHNCQTLQKYRAALISSRLSSPVGQQLDPNRDPIRLPMPRYTRNRVGALLTIRATMNRTVPVLMDRYHWVSGSGGINNA